MSGRTLGWWLRGLAFLGAIILWLPGDWPDRSEPVWLLLPILLVGASAWAIIVRERRPYALWAVGLVGVVGGTTGILAAGLLVLAMRRRLAETLAAAAAGVLLVLVVNGGPLVAAATHGRVRTGSELATWIIGTVVLAIVLPTLTGGFLYSRDMRITVLQQQVIAEQARQDHRQAEAIAREQQRIAGEMHDSLGHQLVLISMHAHLLTASEGRDPALTLEQARAIGSAAGAALSDLRAVVLALREPDRDGPAPGHAAVARLVRKSVAAGGQVTLLDDLAGRDDLADLPESVSTTIYRVVQESLTNAHKHAHGAPVIVRITGAPGDVVRVSIENPLPVAAPATTGSRAGLTALAGRVHLLGGIFEAGPQDGAFLVVAQLPWQVVRATVAVPEPD